MRAAWDGHTEIVDVLVKAGANKDLQNKDGDSALTEAAYQGLTEVVVVLVTSGANLDLQNNKGDSAVMRATVEHESDVLRELVRGGADLNLQNEEGLTALMVASRSGRHELTDILLTGPHIDVDIQENTTNWSALFFSAERGDVTTTQSLLKAGANPHLTDKNGLTALDVATASGSDEVCELLSQASATPHSHPCDIATDEDTSAAEQDSTPSQQDTSTVQQDIPSTDEDCSTTDQDISTSGRRRQRVTQALRNLANSSGKRIREIFAALDRRLKSADKKERSGVKGGGKDGGQRKQKKKTTGKRPSESSSTSNIVPTH
jgi:ankyrin repeat protein